MYNRAEFVFSTFAPSILLCTLAASPLAARPGEYSSTGHVQIPCKRRSSWIRAESVPKKGWRE